MATVFLRDISHSPETTTWITGRVLLVLFTATVFSHLLVENDIPPIIAQGLPDMTSKMYVIWGLIIAFLLFDGMFMETLATIMILTPVLLPIRYHRGVDPVHFGVVNVLHGAEKPSPDALVALETHGKDFGSRQEFIGQRLA